MCYEEYLKRITAELCDMNSGCGGSFVIAYDGIPVGEPIDLSQVETIRSWLAGALPELEKRLMEELEALYEEEAERELLPDDEPQGSPAK